MAKEQGNITAEELLEETEYEEIYSADNRKLPYDNTRPSGPAAHPYPTKPTPKDHPVMDPVLDKSGIYDEGVSTATKPIDNQGSGRKNQIDGGEA